MFEWCRSVFFSEEAAASEAALRSVTYEDAFTPSGASEGKGRIAHPNLEFVDEMPALIKNLCFECARARGFEPSDILLS